MSDEPEFAPDLPFVMPIRFVALEAFAATDEEGAEPLVTDRDKTGAAIPSGGLAIVYGDGGAGKTTLLIDVSLHLAAGIDWCGVLCPTRPLRLAWVENEGPRPMMRKKFRAKLSTWTGRPDIAGGVIVLDEPWALFTFRSADHRAALAAELDTADIDILVVGPLSSLGMEGGGTDDEIDDFLKLVKEVQAACARPPAVLIVHHENKAGDVSGAWRKRPDTLIHVQGQGHGRTRVHWQKMRWCSVLHGTSTNLIWADGESFTVEDKPEISDDTIADDILAALVDLPGGSWSKIRDRVTGNLNDAAKVRDRLLTTGRIVNSSAREGHFKLWLSDDPAAPRSEPGTALERLPFLAPDGAAEPHRSPVPTSSRNGERNGTAGPGSKPAANDARSAA